MSWLDKFKNSRFGRPFRKRQKLGEDEDDWCDALSNLHMDSSSSDEFVDAHEQVPVNSSPKGRKRKKTKSKNKNKKQKDSEIFGDSSSSSSTADTFTGIEGTAEIHPANPQEEQPAIWSTVKGKKTQRKEKLQKRKSSKMQYPSPQPFTKPRQGWKERSKSTGHDGYMFNPGQKCSDSRFKFGSAPEIASSSSSNVDEQMDTQHAQGGLTDAKLLEVAKAIDGNVRTSNQLGRCLGFNYIQLEAYHPQGISVGYSGTMSMLQDWKHKTSQQQRVPKLLAALKNSGLCSVASKLDIKEDPSAATPRNTGQFASGVAYKASTSLSSAVDKTQSSDKASASYDEPIVHQQTAMESQMETAGITERQLEQLAYNLNRDIEYRHVSSLGQQLGYSSTVVFGYCGYEKRISGILNLLRAWRFKTSKSQQVTELIEALRKANLNNLAANLHQTQEGMDDPMYSRGEKSTGIDKTTSQLEALSKRNIDKAMDDAMDSREEGSTSFDKPASQLKVPSKKNLIKVGISDSQLKQLATSLLREDPQNTDTFLQKLGIKSAELDRYRDSGRQRDSSGIVRMLRAWRDKTNDKKQKNELLAALKKAKLQHLDAFLHQSEDVPIDSTEGLTSTDELAKREAFLKSDTDEVGISDGQLKQLANNLLSADYRSKHSLGLELGFKRNEVKHFCRSVEPRDSSGILRMLRTWRDKPTDKNQKNELLTALKKAELQHLTVHLLKLEGGQTAPIPLNRKVTVTLMTSSQFYTISGLKKKLETLRKLRPDLIDAVKVLQLPYSRIQHYRFSEDVDIMILCHSIENRRFAITNVTDSLYDEFLDYCHGKFGKEKIVVVAHDFPPEAKEVRAVKMDSFKHTQWSTFEKAGLVMICGMMDKKPEMQEEDWDSLVRFLEAASKPTPGKDDPRLPLPGQKDSGECNPESNKWGGSKPQTTKSVSAKISEKTSSVFRFGSPKLVSREPIIYLCTSFGLHSVRGLEEILRNLLEKFHNKFKITAQELPYNYSDLREFRFPAETGANDAMILCHSMQNRGFLITDVENSIYDQYLHHCKKVFGKEHVAVIVHDFDCSEEILGIHMDAFQRTQPKTFQLAGFVALARNATNVQLSRKDSTKLEDFVKKIR